MSIRHPLALTLLCFATGCGSQENSYRVSGKVTYDGKPVPAGRVIFEPDAAKGNTGPQGFAVITNGEFDTARPGSKGSIGGPMLVKIDGFDGVPRGEEGPPLGTPLFPAGDVQELDLPKADSTHDFAIPQTQASR